MTSRAVQYARYGGPEVLEIVEREDPQPGPGQVRLAVRAASVNPIDWKLRSGGMASSDAPDRPVIAGVDLAGTVEAVGEGVTAFGVGDEVLGHAKGGAYAEKALADTSALAPRPGGLSWEVAGALPVVTTTAYRGLALLGLGEGDDTAGKVLVVNGASGGVGVVATQVAVARGVTVIGTASERHQDDVEALGATPVVYGEGLADRVRTITDHVDAAFDTAGKGALGDLVALTGSADRVITIADPDAAKYDVKFTGGAGAASEEVEGALADFVGGVASGQYRAPGVTVYPLEQAGKAQEDNRTGAVSGKLVITP
ncbi:MAG TPA: NADP-dependent oxidoreductase [Actinomycetospora sp.]|jgi:NADPH:quinone reductase-like Zn-dependent oxidoreductase|uniref:NADP-dependent oxidoreductase n=1 Tax=Actinomycetospora sp. TaxID=1872135 RepID=UPI002F408B43